MRILKYGVPLLKMEGISVKNILAVKKEMNHNLFYQIDEERERDWDFIEDDIYLGNIFASHDNQLIGNWVKYCICLTQKIDHQEPAIEYIHLPIADDRNADILPLCEQAYDYINEIRAKGNKVLIYCFAGKSRSATIVVYYFMKKYNMNFETAHSFVKEKRSCISLNPGFIAQLKAVSTRIILGKLIVD